MALLVGPVLGEPTPHFPLYLVEAVLVELIALRVRKPLPFALASGAAIGTVGLAAEWGWTQVFMPYPWNAALLPEGVLLGPRDGARGRVRRRLDRRAAERAPHGRAASGGGAGRGGDLRADRLRPAVDRRAAACAARSR